MHQSRAIRLGSKIAPNDCELSSEMMVMFMPVIDGKPAAKSAIGATMAARGWVRAVVLLCSGDAMGPSGISDSLPKIAEVRCANSYACE